MYKKKVELEEKRKKLFKMRNDKKQQIKKITEEILEIDHKEWDINREIEKLERKQKVLV